MNYKNELKYWRKRYEDKFNVKLPQINENLSDKALCQLLHESVRWNENLNEMDEISFLQAQYEAEFDETLTYNYMTIHTEEELITALRECLETGKPYELPADVEQLLEQGAVF